MTSVLLAHPQGTSFELGAPPAAFALVAALLAAAVLNLGRVRPVPLDSDLARRPDDAALPRWASVTRAVGLALLLLVCWAGRFRAQSELDNLASPLVTGVFLPGVVLGSAALGAWFWRALDPVDSLARLVDREPVVAGPVWPAVAAALGVVGYLHAFARTTPTPAAYAVAGYVVVLLAVGIALGRSWAARADVVALLAQWVGLRARLASWRAPAGAEAVLGTLVGGTLGGELVGSPWWEGVRLRGAVSAGNSLAEGGLPLDLSLRGVNAVTVLSLALLGAAAADRLGRWAERRGAPGSVAASLVPVTAALLLAAQLRRLLICVQLLVDIASDPLAQGRDLFGTARSGVDPQVLGVVGQRYLALGAVGLGAVLAAVVLARRTSSPRAQDPAALAIYAVTALAALAAATTF